MRIIESNEIFDLLQSFRKVSRVNYTVEDIQRWVNTINAINACDEFTNWIGNNQISEYEVPEFLKGLILPAKVSLKSNRDSLNQKDYIEYDVNALLNIREFNRVTQYILGSLKVSSDKVWKVVRPEVLTLTDAEDRLVVNGYVHNPVCMPIEACGVSQFNEMSYYSTTTTDALLNFITEQLKTV